MHQFTEIATKAGLLKVTETEKILETELLSYTAAHCLKYSKMLGISVRSTSRFLRVDTESGSSLLVTPEIEIFVNGDFLPVRKVHPGDQAREVFGWSRIVKITKVEVPTSRYFIPECESLFANGVLIRGEHQ